MTIQPYLIALQFALRPSHAEQKMFGKTDLVHDLSRNLDRARGRRDALASDVTTLTSAIADIEARLSAEKSRRERDRALGDIEAIKKRVRRAASAFAPLVRELCEATEMAAAIVPEAREVNSFLSSVAAEVDTVIDPLLCELDRCMDEVRASYAEQHLPGLEIPTELPRDHRKRRRRFPIWLSRHLLPGYVRHLPHRLLNIATTRDRGFGMGGARKEARDNKTSPTADARHGLVDSGLEIARPVDIGDEPGLFRLPTE
jgi:hypothetical protein